jgi:hypothetical protein
MTIKTALYIGVCVCALLALVSAFFCGYRIRGYVLSTSEQSSETRALATSLSDRMTGLKKRASEISKKYGEKEVSILNEAEARAGSFQDSELGALLFMQSSSPVPR